MIAGGRLQRHRLPAEALEQAVIRRIRELGNVIEARERIVERADFVRCQPEKFEQPMSTKGTFRFDDGLKDVSICAEAGGRSETLDRVDP